VVIAHLRHAVKRRAGEWLLALGMLAGLGLGAYDLGARRSDQAPLSADVVATVNGHPIQRLDYERALAAVAADRRAGALDAALAQRVLDRLIDEELLVQRGMELDLLARDPAVRSALVAAVLGLYATRADEAGAEQADPGDAMLGAFLRDNLSRFRQPPRLRVQRLLGPGEAPGPADPPDVLLPLAKLRDYVGEAATTALAGLPVGGELAPAAGQPRLRLLARDEGREPVLAAVRAQVLAEYRRQAGDRRLRAMLDERRRHAEIHLAADVRP
jgi:hypothetical protein